MRARALAAVAAILLGLLSGLSAPSPGTSAPAPRSAAVTSAEGSISPATGTPALSLRAVEPATPTSLVRSEGRQTVRALATFLLLLVLLVGTHMWRSAHGRLRAVGLAVRAQTEWWRPAPGRRAPPRLSTR